MGAREKMKRGREKKFVAEREEREGKNDLEIYYYYYFPFVYSQTIKHDCH
jgi:hypothetical protein